MAYDLADFFRFDLLKVEPLQGRHNTQHVHTKKNAQKTLERNVSGQRAFKRLGFMVMGIVYKKIATFS